MKHTIQLRAKVPTIISSVFLAVALAFSLTLYLVNAVQLEAQGWYPDEYWNQY